MKNWIWMLSFCLGTLTYAQAQDRPRILFDEKLDISVFALRNHSREQVSLLQTPNPGAVSKKIKSLVRSFGTNGQRTTRVPTLEVPLEVMDSEIHVPLLEFQNVQKQALVLELVLKSHFSRVQIKDQSLYARTGFSATAQVRDTKNPYAGAVLCTCAKLSVNLPQQESYPGPAQLPDLVFAIPTSNSPCLDALRKKDGTTEILVSIEPDVFNPAWEMSLGNPSDWSDDYALQVGLLARVLNQPKTWEVRSPLKITQAGKAFQRGQADALWGERILINNLQDLEQNSAEETQIFFDTSRFSGVHDGESLILDMRHPRSGASRWLPNLALGTHVEITLSSEKIRNNQKTVVSNGTIYISDQARFSFNYELEFPVFNDSHTRGAELQLWSVRRE